MKKRLKCCTYNVTGTEKILTVMYLTSMSVFLSSSAIISRWNLLNFRRGGVRRREEWSGGSKRREHMQMIRAPTPRHCYRRAVRRRAASASGAVIRAASPRARRGECPGAELAACEWVRNKAWESLLCSPSRSCSLEPERATTARPRWGTIKLSAAGQAGGLRGLVRPSPATMSR